MAVEVRRVEKIKVERHSLTFRILHWIIVIEGIILGLTGISLSEYLDMNFINLGMARSIHIVTGLAFTASAWLFLYYFIVSGEYKWFGLRRIPYGIDYLFQEIRSFFTGAEIEDPIEYDVDRNMYREKVIPTEILAWWIWFITGVIIISSGLSLIYPDELMFIHKFWGFVIPDIGGEPMMSTRMIHLLSSGFALAVLIIHVYSSWIFGMVKSIIYGYRFEKAVYSIKKRIEVLNR